MGKRVQGSGFRVRDDGVSRVGPSSLRGSALVFAMFILFFMGTVMTAAMTLFTAQVSAMSREHSRVVALHLAEGGLEWALAKLRQSRSYRGDTGVPLGDGTFSVAVRQVGNRFEIHSSGKVPDARGAVIQTLRAEGHFAGKSPTVDLWVEMSPKDMEII
ncbi:MAG: hypothetical protein COZ56_07975 [Armatimonadetes bacterium CG_4_8_14_3_um_filter_58_9]|nr:MAG: hypothetical protein COZ56_07975 [Armatimonadetes bacterium CG_4_8_14_3_um_filter_58_9]PJB74759.1 MAG: hypothetical protein CO095_04415 [Armatimonadetes bacterium CG_4_9_14_3_um_filter_58_7]